MPVRHDAGLRLVGAKHNVLATILVFALLAGIVPFNLIGSIELCTMSCCAMRGPHSVASHCSGSVCHLDTLPRKEVAVAKQEPAGETGHSEPQAAGQAPLTDPAANAVVKESSTVTAGHLNHNGFAIPERLQSAHHPQSPMVINGAVITSACPRSCGAVTAYSFSQHRQSEPAMPAAFTSPRKAQGRTPFSPALLSSLLWQQFPPRAPPSILS